MPTITIRLQVRRHTLPGRWRSTLSRCSDQDPELAGSIELNRLPLRISGRNCLSRDVVTDPEHVFCLGGLAYPNRELAFLVANESLDAQTITVITVMAFVK
jgi:hypothetical protein